MERARRGIVEQPPKAAPAPRRQSTPIPARNSAGDGPPCPTNPDHGRLWWMNDTGRYYCSHSEHIGRLNTHPEGGSPPTRAWFRRDEVDQ